MLTPRILLDAHPRGMAHLNRVAADGVELVRREYAILLARRAKIGVRPKSIAEDPAKSGIAALRNPTCLLRARCLRSGCCGRVRSSNPNLSIVTLADANVTRLADQDREIDHVAQVRAARFRDPLLCSPGRRYRDTRRETHSRAGPFRAAWQVCRDCRRSSKSWRWMRSAFSSTSIALPLKLSAAFRRVSLPTISRSCAPGASVSSEEISIVAWREADDAGRLRSKSRAEARFR